MTTTGEAGRDAEARAEAYLAAQGLTCIARNYRCRLGEIDLVMRDGRTVVFIEVRARASSAYGGAAASITDAKRRRVLAAARHWLAGRSPLPPCRFDAVLLEGDALCWLRGAFTAD